MSTSQGIVPNWVSKEIPGRGTGTITQRGLYTAPAVAANVEIGTTVRGGLPQTYVGGALIRVVVPPGQEFEGLP